jgi:hypothetical protein
MATFRAFYRNESRGAVSCGSAGDRLNEQVDVIFKEPANEHLPGARLGSPYRPFCSELIDE